MSEVHVHIPLSALLGLGLAVASLIALLILSDRRPRPPKAPGAWLQPGPP